METISIDTEITIKIGDNKIKLSRKDAEVLYNSLFNILGKHTIYMYDDKIYKYPYYLLDTVRC